MKQLFVVTVEDNRDPSQYRKLREEDIRMMLVGTAQGTDIRFSVSEQPDISDIEEKGWTYGHPSC